MPTSRVAIVGGGWAGMTAAVRLQQAGCDVHIWEASRTWGGRARALRLTGTDGTEVVMVNGQHILIGAYRDCLAMMRTVGVAPEQHLLRLPLDLRYADGQGLRLPHVAPPWDALWGIARSRGWTWREKWALLQRAAHWQRSGFTCAPSATVADVCCGLTARLMRDFVDPLCISALNLTADAASGTLFLRVLRDALFSGAGGSNLLIPTTDLGRLFPASAAQWLQARGAQLHVGERVTQLQPHGPSGTWQVQGQAFDAVVLATSASEAARLVQPHASAWAQTAAELQHTAIATVYAYSAQAAQQGLQLPAPMVALRSSAQAPAQFAFDKSQLHGPKGWLALVISACEGDKDELQARAIAQARSELGWHDLQAVQTVIDKRATFACTPQVQRPDMAVAPGLWACGDYVQGPYPATLEGAVRSGMAVTQALVDALKH